MSSADNDAAAKAPVRRLRWSRFSPSMGWKAFFSEIVIVVLGVAIALAANEAVEEWNWKNKVRDGEVRMRGDVEWAFVWMAEQYATRPCVEAQLTELTRNLMESGATLTPVPVFSDVSTLRYVVRIPYRPYRYSVWDALVANGTATHFSQRQQDAYGFIGSEMERMRLRTEEANRFARRLIVMAYPIALDDGIRKELLAEMTEMNSGYDADAYSAQQRLRRIVENGIAPNAEVVGKFLGESGTVQFCKKHELPLADWRDFYK